MEIKGDFKLKNKNIKDPYDYIVARIQEKNVNGVE